jgi:hypothetical protein
MAVAKAFSRLDLRKSDHPGVYRPSLATALRMKLSFEATSISCFQMLLILYR